MKTSMWKLSAGTLAALTLTTALGGCVYRERTTVPAASVPIVTAPSASPTTVIVPPATAQRTVTYPAGMYELRGLGTVTNPYYWVWVPRGTVVGTLPPPPPLPIAR